MSTALDRFEQSLVTASTALGLDAGRPHPDADEPRTQAARSRRSRRSRPLRKLGALGLTAQVAVGVASLSVCAGAAVAAYTLLSGAPARLLPGFQCQMSDNADASIPAVTGSPILDCAGQWSQASGGREAAPPLAIWGEDTGRRVVAVAAPVSAGPPAGGDWKRLPDSWTVSLPIVALGDQLANINLPFNAGHPGAGCSYLPGDIDSVRSLLVADGLSGWAVTTQGQLGPVMGGCHFVSAVVEGQAKTVLLVQAQPNPAAPKAATTTGDGFATATTTTATTTTATTTTAGPTTATTTSTDATSTATTSTGAATAPSTVTTNQPALSTGHAQALNQGVTRAYAQLGQLYTSVNATLDSTCDSVPAATALWTQAAQAAGFSPTTLAFWHQANTTVPIDPHTFFEHYTLYQQPASQHTGSCAHVLVMDVGGSGIPNVYVARIPL